jgi:hypothetical protein
MLAKLWAALPLSFSLPLSPLSLSLSLSLTGEEGVWACFMLARVHTPSSPVRERERGREREKERERESYF